MFSTKFFLYDTQIILEKRKIFILATCEMLLNRSQHYVTLFSVEGLKLTEVLIESLVAPVLEEFV